MLNEFFNAIKKGDLALVEKMIAHDPSLVDANDEQGLTPVLVATYFSEKGIAQFLIAQGAFLNLYEACATGQLARVETLLNAQPDHLNTFSPDGFQPLGLAAFFGQTEVAAYLLKRGAEVDTPSQNGLSVTPLNSAVAGNHISVTRQLLEHGADPNARQSGGFVPLHSAAQNGNLEIAQLLIKYGADKNIKNDEGKTALDMAREKQSIALLPILE